MNIQYEYIFYFIKCGGIIIMNKKVECVFGRWMNDIACNDNVVGIRDQLDGNSVNVVVYLRKSVEVMGYFPIYIRDLRRNIEDLSTEDLKYTLSVRLIDFYEEERGYIDINRFISLPSNNIEKTITDAIRGYTKNDVNCFITCKPTMKSKDLALKLVVYSKDGHVLMGGKDGVREIKNILKDKFSKTKFIINLYESNLVNL